MRIRASLKPSDMPFTLGDIQFAISGNIKSFMNKSKPVDPSVVARLPGILKNVLEISAATELVLPWHECKPDP
jgi:hypothetical protein